MLGQQCVGLSNQCPGIVDILGLIAVTHEPADPLMPPEFPPPAFWHDLSQRIGTPWSRPGWAQIGGFTDYPIEAQSVVCNCHCPAGTSTYTLSCTVSWSARIYINANSGFVRAGRANGVYGHEQRHIVSTRNLVDRRIVARLRAAYPTHYTGRRAKENCSTKARLAEGRFQGELRSLFTAIRSGGVNTHRGGPPGWWDDDSPIDGSVDYEPLPGSPEFAIPGA